MHELLLIEVPETLDTKSLMHPVTIMTRAPVAATIRSSFISSLSTISLNALMAFAISTYDITFIVIIYNTIKKTYYQYIILQ